MRLPVMVAILLSIGAVRLPCSDEGQASREARTLSVSVLPTEYAQTDVGPDTYPATVTVIVPPKISGAAYGATGRIWLGPPTWTGNADVGMDGSILVRLFPIGGNPASGPVITYSAEIGCAGCKIADAAPYFPAAMKAWNNDDNIFGDAPVARPKGLRIRRLSRTLVTYTLPDENKLQIRGAAFYDDTTWTPFEEVRLKLPPADAGLADFLIKYFGEHRLRLWDR